MQPGRSIFARRGTKPSFSAANSIVLRKIGGMPEEVAMTGVSPFRPATAIASVAYKLSRSPDLMLLHSNILNEPWTCTRLSMAIQAAVATVSQWEAEETNYEGLRVKVDEGEGSEGWLMNRMSLHEPIVIFNVESEVKGGVAAIAATLLHEVLGPLKKDLDLSSLEERVAAAKRK